MKVAIFGAGAIGGMMGVKLASAGAELSVVARGPHLAAMQTTGLTLIEGETRTTIHPRATADAAELGPQDYVIVTLKAHSLPTAAALSSPPVPLFAASLAPPRAFRGRSIENFVHKKEL